MKKSNIPYFYGLKNHKTENFKQYKYLKNTFSPKIKNNFKYGTNNLIEKRHSNFLKKIKKYSKKNQYFLRIDIEKFFPSISHEIFKKEIEENYKILVKPTLSRKMEKFIKNNLKQFCNSSPFEEMAIPIGNSLSGILSTIFLLKIEKELNKNKITYLKWADDFLIFFNEKKEIEQNLKKIIVPCTKKLKINLNPLKTQSGKIHKDSLNFLGFDYHGGIFSINKNKIKEFQKKIIELTVLNKKTKTDTLIKKINYKIRGFGHFYKFAKCKNDFKKLDSFIRKRIRRKILHLRNNENKQGNFILTNQILEQMNLRSLSEIKTIFDQKKERKNKKRNNTNTSNNNKSTTQKSQKNNISADLNYSALILRELRILTVKIEKIQKKLKK